MRNQAKPPHRGKLLFENLFGSARTPKATLEIISRGILATINNAARLLNDARILFDAERYASGQFLLATSNEEISKIYILVDACRLDFSKRRDKLLDLCNAFYSHEAKYAYQAVVNYAYEGVMNRIQTSHMIYARNQWQRAIVKWWPGDDEYGEPDLPHDTFFLREMPLYVDCGCDGHWWEPQGLSPLVPDSVQKTVERTKRTSVAGLYAEQSLGILNENFRDLYVNEKTTIDEIERVHDITADVIQSKLGVPQAAYFESSLHTWPLYHFAGLRTTADKLDPPWPFDVDLT